MALKLTVSDIETIPEPQRSLYRQDGDVYRLDVEGLEDTAGLKSALDKERKAVKDAVAMTKAWKELGKTPEEIAALLESQRKADEDRAKKAGEFDKLRKQMDDQHQAELANRDNANKALRMQLERTLVDAEGARALAAAKANSELLMPHLKSRVKVIEENGEFVVRVVDSQGTPRVNAKGDFLSIPDVVSEMRQSDIFAPAFMAPNASGGGARQSAGNGARTMTRAAFEALDPGAKVAAAKTVAIVDS